MGFATKLRSLMEFNNIKAVELARKTGLSEAAISDYLKGKKEPRGKQSIEIAKALNVSLDTLWETEFAQKKFIADSSDELWNKICSDDSKLMLARWISNLDQDQLEMVVKLLEAARLSPRE